MSAIITKRLSTELTFASLLGIVCSTALLCACGPANDGELTTSQQKDKLGQESSAIKNTSPTISVEGLTDTDQSSTTGIDFIIDGSASMCGYFQANVNSTPSAMPITTLVEQIQAISRRDKDKKSDRKKDKILIFMQDESENESRYIDFSKYENQLLQGHCQLKGQYTQLGLIMQEYQQAPDLAKRSFVIISDMHLLPSEQRVFDSSYDTLLESLFDQTNHRPNVSNGILSLRSPFVGQYYTVDNDKIELKQIPKHIHFFWFAKNKSDAKLIQELQTSLSQKNKDSIYAQAEFLPQLRLLTQEAKQYSVMTPPTTVIKPQELINIASDKTPFISGMTPANDKYISEGQRYCYTLNWGDDKMLEADMTTQTDTDGSAKDKEQRKGQAVSSLNFYPYPMAKTNTSNNCVDGELFRSKTGSTLKLNLPVNQTQYSIAPRSPTGISVEDGYLSIPIVDNQGKCIAKGGSGQTVQSFTLSYQGSNQPIEKSYYDLFSIERDGCRQANDCSNLEDKTFKYGHLIDSLANKAKQHIDESYPKDITISLNCESS